MVLGLLIGSGVQALLPREWLAKALGKAGLEHLGENDPSV